MDCIVNQKNILALSSNKAGTNMTKPIIATPTFRCSMFYGSTSQWNVPNDPTVVMDLA